MKMKSNNLPAVLLTAIIAAAIIFTCGLFSQAYADYGDYDVEIGSAMATHYTGLPGSTIRLGATVYRDFEGEEVVDQDDLEFRWELGAGDSQFAKLKVFNIDGSLAHVTFKPLPEGQTEIEAYVTVKVSVYADGQKVATDSVELTERTDFYILNSHINEYLKIGDPQEVYASVSHYSMDVPEGEFVKNVQFTWYPEGAPLEITKNTEKSTDEESIYDVARKSYEETMLVLEAKWGEGDDAREEYTVLWTKNIPTDMNEFKITLPDTITPWQMFVDDDLPITRAELETGTNVHYGNLYLEQGTDYDLVVYKYNGYDEESGEINWVEHEGDLAVDQKGSAPDINGEPTEGTATYKVVAKAKGDILTGETEDYAQYIFMYSNRAFTGYAPLVAFGSAYIQDLEDDPYWRVEVKPGTQLDPEVTLNDEIMNPATYKCVYEGENNDYIGEEFPTEPGLYTMHIEGVEPYYGTSYSQYIKVGMDNTNFKASGKTVKVKVGKKKKKTTKNKTFAKSKAFKVSGNEGTVTFKKSSGNKKITVASNGKVTVKKGLKKGTYKVKVKVTDNESDEYFAVTKTVTLKVKVTK